MRLSSILKSYAKKKETPIHLKYLYTFNPIKQQTIFLKEELSIRLSHRIFDIYKLPYGLPVIPEIKSVINLYKQSFEKLNSHPKIITNNNIETFTETLNNIKDNHKDLEFTIAKGLNKLDNPLIHYNIINNVLNTFFLSRISIRTLISHQINTFNNTEPIISNCNISYIIQETIKDIKYISEKYLDNDIEINFNNIDKGDIYMYYVKSHLYYVFNEILKNSIIAHNKYNIKEPISITINQTNKYVIINIKDNGMGFDIDNLSKIMSYSYSTSNINNLDNSYILSGFGFGIPLTNLYIKYFNGIIQINPVENVGTNIYIYIKKLDNTIEQL